MVFKGIIKELPQNDNRYLVRIPPLEDNTTTEMVLSALLCNQPGEYGSYKVGDVVFVEFENNKLDTPIILGKLYTGVPEEGLGYFKIDRLEVTGNLIMPNDTKLAGYSAEDFFDLYQRAENTLEKLDGAIFYKELGEF